MGARTATLGAALATLSTLAVTLPITGGAWRGGPAPPPQDLLVPTAAAAPKPRAKPATLALRPGDPLPTLGPAARVDKGLRAAAEDLAASATSADARLTPTATRLALARAGYPGDARFLLARGDATAENAVVAALLDGVPRGEPIDVGWAYRDLGDTRVYVLGWAPRRLSIDPVPRDLRAGQGVSVRVGGASAPRLLVGHPDGKVDELALTDGVARWVDRFDQPGEHRVEVVDGDRVELLFSLFVDTPVPPPAPLAGPAATPDPDADLPHLYAAIDRFRADAGLPPLARFAAFEPHARAHAACLASAGVVAHDTPSCPGVPALATRTHFPRAKHTENVAAGDTAAEAWERVLASPGHRLNLACAACTHVAIGATLEPGPAPRTFIVWELLTFPEGPPEAIPARK